LGMKLHDGKSQQSKDHIGSLRATIGPVNG